MILAEKIVELRKKNGWSQEELAEKLNISRQSVSKWEGGASIPDLDKIIKLSALFSVSTDYLLKDELEEADFTKEPDAVADVEQRSVSMEEANDYLQAVRRHAKRIAAGAAICLLSPIYLITVGGLAEAGVISWSEDMAGGIGTTVLLLLIALGAGLLIASGMALSRYDYLEKEKLILQYGVQGMAEKKKAEFAHTFRICVITSVVLWIVGATPLLLAGGFRAGELVLVFCLDILLIMIAGATALFVWAGCLQGSFEKILEEGDYTPKKKEISGKIAPFIAAYWCLAAAVYLAISFANNSWDTSWVVWPVAAVLFAAIYALLEAAAGAGTGKRK